MNNNNFQSVDSGIAHKPSKPTLWTKLSYGFGAAAFGIKNNGFDYFLLLFYSQVVGLDARLVGIAITAALVIDAISDPIVGYWSDNLRSRWGRRHPFMYAAAVPVSLSYFFLWSPPLDWSQMELFWYLLIMAVFIRMGITLYETPSTALVPELTDDYVQRSSLLSFRYYFGWTGGNTMSVLMFLFLFPAFVTASITDGRFNADSYSLYGKIASVLIFISIIVSSLGTHSQIPNLKAPPPKRELTLGAIIKEIADTLADRSFFSLFFAALLGAIGTGLSAALTFYFWTYFWGFSSIQTGLITMGTFLAAFIGLFLAPIVTNTIGKKRGAMIVGLVAFIGSPLPMALELLGVLPESKDFTFWFVFITGVIDTGLIICFQILVASMMADLVDQSELKTGRRSEGVFFAASTFIRKATQGIGLMLASMLLYLADFQQGADTTQVAAESIDRLVMLYIPAILFIWLTMIAVISTYRLDRKQHEENLRKLKAINTEKISN
ncbi:sugar transporter [marine gamma proteobacterium HTCC2143]|jgi:GPH family glycoside/pentoside/hexuronide:cation symporter|uniref:Sugar transporter n=1 Tax=marine gamma proteobacterium HTCC2143 TaxID=247633 RepID=A0YDE6_9GAMM|nr:sugar transporter [marine gamma proteobacterium HTCC2143]